MRLYAIETWGCQMNVHDSERLEAALRSHGLRPAGRGEAPDLVILNTCSVRERPVHKLVARIAELERCEPRPIVGVCGCVAQQEGAALLERSPVVGFVVGPRQLTRVGEALRRVEAGHRLVLTGFTAEVEEGPDALTTAPAAAHRAMVTVIEGCSECCAFCVVPYTRGPEVSRPLPVVMDEVRAHIEGGVVEIELLGQTVNAYTCPDTGTRFAGLLDQVAGLDGLCRVRFITSHPRHFEQELIDVIARRPSISRYLHLPVQSGSDRILGLMKRRHTRADYLDLVARVREGVPDVNLSTDIIVGFPGESEADFQMTLDLLHEVRFGQVFAFAYSARPRTAAARLTGAPSPEVARARLHRLFELTDSISLELNENLVGTVVQVLIDGDSRRSANDWQGRAHDGRVVNFPKREDAAVGDLVDVRVLRAGPHSLAGAATCRPASPR